MFDLIGCYVIHSICIYIQYLSYNPVYLCMSLYQSIKITPTNMYIARARVQFNINTGVYITTGSYQMVWQLSRATWALSLELFFLGQSQWYGMNMLDIWQLTTLPQSECHEFMVGYMCFPVPNQNINATSMYIARARAQFKIWQGMKKLDNCQLGMLTQSEHHEFNPHMSTKIYWFLCELCVFPCARASKIIQQTCLSPEPGRTSKLSHTGVEISTFSFQTVCQLHYYKIIFSIL